jgi:hypothetical protein
MRARLRLWRTQAGALSEEQQQRAVREAVLGWRDGGAGGRTAASELVAALLREGRAPRALVERHLAACLALPEAGLLAGALGLMAALLHEEEWEEKGGSAEEVWEPLMRVGLRLARDSGQAELAGAGVGLLTAGVRRGLLDEGLAPVCEGLWAAQPSAAALKVRQNLRRELMVLCERLVGRLGPEAVSAAMPTDDGRALVAALARKKRKKQRDREVLRNGGGGEGEEEGEEGAKKESEKKEPPPQQRFLDPRLTDLLEPGARAAQVAAVPGRSGRRRGREERDEGQSGGEEEEEAFPLDPLTGRLLIQEESAVAAGNLAAGRVGDGQDYEPSSGDDDDDNDGDGDVRMALAGTSAADSAAAGTKKKNRKKNDPMSGAMYKARKAEGDLRKGKLDPFAYVRLDPKNLNRRRAGHTADQFQTVFGKKRSSASSSKGHAPRRRKSGNVRKK